MDTLLMPIVQTRKPKLREDRLAFGPGSFSSKVKCRSAWLVNLLA